MKSCLAYIPYLTKNQKLKLKRQSNLTLHLSFIFFTNRLITHLILLKYKSHMAVHNSG